MTIYMNFDNGSSEDIATTHGWGELSRWIDKHQTIAAQHLRDWGWTDNLLMLLDDFDELDDDQAATNLKSIISRMTNVINSEIDNGASAAIISDGLSS
jgi:hypothetical protein